MVQDVNWWQAPVNMLMNLQFPRNVGNFLNSWAYCLLLEKDSPPFSNILNQHKNSVQSDQPAIVKIHVSLSIPNFFFSVYSLPKFQSPANERNNLLPISNVASQILLVMDNEFHILT
jgi:hypothetical protein